MSRGGKALKQKDSQTDYHIVKSNVISEILGFKTTRRVEQLAKEGVFVRVGRGQYDLAASIQGYIEYLLEAGTMVEGKLDKTQEEAKWVLARRRKTELELQIMKGELHRAEDVQMVMSDMLGNFRARLLSIPSKVAPQLLGKTEIPVIKNILEEVVREAMNELSDYDPNVFYEYSKDNLFLEEDDLEDTIIDEIEMEQEKNGRKKKE